MKVYDTIHDAYLGTLEDVYDNPDSTSAPRGQKVREKFNYQFTIVNPKVENIITKDPQRNLVIADYSQKEFHLYESCSNLAEDFGKASKFWLKLANPDGTVNSAYGYLVFRNKSHGNFQYEVLEPKTERKVYGDGTNLVISPNFYEIEELQKSVTYMRTPWEWCVLALKKDKDTRQAILRFSLPEHFWDGNKDFTCTLHGYFQIRDNKLSLTINMRSNDLTLGLVYDLPWFISLIHKMKDELKDVYPDLEVGNYTHYVHNLHIYDRDEEKILKMIGRKP